VFMCKQGVYQLGDINVYIRLYFSISYETFDVLYGVSPGFFVMIVDDYAG
jgi:hypothetical protein